MDAIVRYLTKNLPEFGLGWNLFDTLCNLGVHGSIINAPSVLAFSSTSAFGFPILVMCFVFSWFLCTTNENMKTKISYVIFLSINLLSLFLCAEWLYLTFWAAILPFLVLFHKQYKDKFIYFLSLLAFSVFLNKTIGNALFLQDEINHLGRVNVFNVGIKSNIFLISTWGRLSTHLNNYAEIPVLSWDFFAEFGMTLILLPLLLFLIWKNWKDLSPLAVLIFFSALFTMPAPLVIDFKANPTDFNRMFAFGNPMLALLTAFSIWRFTDLFSKNKLIPLLYIFLFSFSPISQLLIGAVFAPSFYTEKNVSHLFSEPFFKSKDLSEAASMYLYLNKEIYRMRNNFYEGNKEAREFLRKNSSPGDLAISSIVDLPLYEGVYSLTPPNKFIYQNQIYSANDTLFYTVFSSLDPHLMKELNLKWIVVNNSEQLKVPQELLTVLSTKDLFELAFEKVETDNLNNWIRIYKVINIDEAVKKYQKQTAWTLINKDGQLLEITAFKSNQVTLFDTNRDSLRHLKLLLDANPSLKSELITSQAVIVKSLEKSVEYTNKKLGTNIVLKKG